MFPPGWRERAWRRLGERLDLLVVGGGITGAGVLHDAALRGLAVALVERGDFGGGTSSRSSKLIHGGLRYLRRMQLGITRTACRERDQLALLSPHLVRPMRFLYPSYEHDATPGWQVGLGLSMYDHLTPVHHSHERVDAAEAAALVPRLARGGLEFGLLYDDAVADDARLVHAVGERRGTGRRRGAELRPRRRAAAGPRRAGRGRAGARPGERRHAGSARDRGGERHRRLGGRGAGDGRRGEVQGAPVARLAPALPPRRAAPRRGGDRALGRRRPSRCSRCRTRRGRWSARPTSSTTDRSTTPVPTPEETAYLLRFVQTVFPAARVTGRSVVGAFAGVRPVLSSHAESPSAASREEAVWEERGMVSTAGGKLTTFRATAGKVVDAAVKLLPEARRESVAPQQTAAVALPWRADPVELARGLAAMAVPEDVARGMARRLGALALPAAASGAALRPLADGLDVCAAELVWQLRFGGVVHLEDLLLRRVRLGMWQPRRCLELAPSLRPLLRRAAGWTVARWNAEVARLERAVANWLPAEAE